MSNPLETIAELSDMNRELSRATLDELRGETGRYVARLALMADKSFMHGRLIGGTTVSGYGVVAGRFGRLHTEHVMKGEYMRNIPTPAGNLVTYPLKTVGISRFNHPIVDPSAEGCYSVVHVPSFDSERFSSLFHLDEIEVDLAFSVDQDDVVTVNGPTTATPAEFGLFDGIVQEFERRVATVTSDDMIAARESARYR